MEEELNRLRRKNDELEAENTRQKDDLRVVAELLVRLRQLVSPSQQLPTRDDDIESLVSSQIGELHDGLTNSEKARIELEEERDRLRTELKYLHERAQISLQTLEQAQKQLAETRARLEQLQRDVAALRQVVEHVERMADGNFGRGVDQLRKREYGVAVESMTAAIRLTPWDARFYYFRGLAHYKHGKLKEAEEDVKKGAALERERGSSGAAISKALEFIQGADRQWLESFRPK